jgi:hypothetical protein
MSSAPKSMWGAYGSRRIVRTQPLEEELSAGAGRWVELAGELLAGACLPSPASRLLPERDLLIMKFWRRVYADLHQTRVVLREALCGWAGMIHLVDEAERQSTRRPHRAPPVAVAGDDRSQPNERIGEATIGNLKIEMDPRPWSPIC